MPELTINGITVMVDEGATVLDAAERIAVEIPTLCHLKDSRPRTSCMLCVVKEHTAGKLIPACSARAVDGMRIETECEEVQSARRDMLNLLLSEHVGDCEAPCTRICPSHLDIPLMLREIERGHAAEAAWIARRDLAIPRVLSHVCPAPCEKGCRRGQLDEAISIRSLHGMPDPAEVAKRMKREADTGRRVAVMGSGAAGLACAWQLHLLGVEAAVFDESPVAGGILRGMEGLPPEVLDGEIEALRSAGITFELGAACAPLKAVSGFDGMVIAAQDYSGPVAENVLFAKDHRLVVMSVANGKAAAREMARLLEGRANDGTPGFDSRIGRLRESELQELTGNCPSAVSEYGDARREAARCLHCDCRKPVSCRLRQYAARYGADASEFPAGERDHVQLVGRTGAVVFEPGKCIKCGLCIEVARQHGEPLGLAFIGRGFNTRITVPFGEELGEGLQRAAKACVEICPTGALAFRDGDER